MKIFHRIRQSLLAQGRLTRYLIYAVGEIILVVVGIMIALQLNNLNDQHKRDQLELVLLSEMRQNLNRDLIDCRGNIASHQRWERAQEIILHHLENRTPFHDSLRYHYANLVGSTQLVANTSAYENLKSTGFNLISNDSLRASITELYSEKYEFLSSTELDMDIKMQIEDLAPHIYEKLVMDTVWKTAYPRDLESLRDDYAFQGTIKMSKWMRKIMISQYQGIESQILKMIEMIDREIENRTV